MWRHPLAYLLCATDSIEVEPMSHYMIHSRDDNSTGISRIGKVVSKIFKTALQAVDRKSPGRGLAWLLCWLRTLAVVLLPDLVLVVRYVATSENWHIDITLWQQRQCIDNMINTLLWEGMFSASLPGMIISHGEHVGRNQHFIPDNISLIPLEVYILDSRKSHARCHSHATVRKSPHLLPSHASVTSPKPETITHHEEGRFIESERLLCWRKNCRFFFFVFWNLGGNLFSASRAGTARAAVACGKYIVSTEFDYTTDSESSSDNEGQFLGNQGPIEGW